MPRLFRLRGRWLARIGVGLAALVVLVIVVHTWVVPAVVGRLLAARLGGAVSFRGWWVDGRSAGVVGLVVHEGLRGTQTPVWLSADRATTDLTLGGLLRGRLWPGRVTVRSPRVTLRLDRRGELLSRIGAAAGDLSALPVLVAEGAEVRFRQEGRPEMVVHQVTARLAPDGDKLSLAARSSDPDWGSVQVLGQFSPDFAAGGLELKSTRSVTLTPARVAAIPFVAPEVWENVVPDGEVDVRITLERSASGGGQGTRVRTEIGLHGTTVSSPPLDLTATGTSGTVVVDGLKVLLNDVTGRAIAGGIKARGTLDFSHSPTVFDVDLDLARVNVADTPARWRLGELGVTGRLTGRACMHAVFRPEAVDMSGTTGEASVEEGTIQGIPFKSLRLVMSAKGKDLHYETPKAGGRSSRDGSPEGRRPSSVWTHGVLPLVALQMIASQPPPASKPPQPPAIALPKALTTHIELEDVELAQLIARTEQLLRFPFPLPIAGKLSMKVDVTIPLGKLQVIRDYAFHGDLTLTGASIYGVDVGRMSARVDLADGMLVLSDVRGRLVDRPAGGPDNPPEPEAADVPRTGLLPPGCFRGSLRAGLDPPGPLTVRFEGDNLPLGELVAPVLPRPTPLSGLVTIRSEATADLKTARDPEAWTASGEVTSRQLRSPDAQLDQVAVRFTLKRGRLEVPELTARLQDRPLAARFGVDLKPPHAFRGHLDVTAWDLARVLDWRPGTARAPASGTFSARAEVSGTLHPPRVSSEGQGRFDRLAIGPVTIGKVPFEWTTRDDAIVVTVADAHPLGGQLEAEAAVPVMLGKPITGSATFTAIDTAPLAAAVFRGALALVGKGSGKVDVTILPDGSSFEVTGRLSAPDLSVQGIPAEKVEVSVRTRGGSVGYEVTAESLGGPVRLKGSIPLGDGPRGHVADGELQAVGFLLDRLWKARGITGATARLLGRGAFDANVRAVLEGPGAGLYTHGILELRDLRWGESLPLGRVRGIVAGTPTLWRVDPVSGEILGGPVSGFLRASLPRGDGIGPEAGFELRVDRAPLRNALAFLPGLSRDLDGYGTLQLSGTIGRSSHATADLTVARARVAGVALSDLKVPAELTAAGGNGTGVLRLRQWSARLAGGQFRGDASFRIGTDRTFESNLTLADLDLEPIVRAFTEGPRPASGRVSGRVSLGGPNPEQPEHYRGRVDLNLSDASLVALPVFREIDRFLGAARGGLFERGHLSGTIAGRQIIVDPLTLEGRLVQVHGSGTLGVDGQLNLEVLVNTNQIIPQTGQALVGLIPGLRNGRGRNAEDYLQVANFLSNRLLKLRVTGTLRSPTVAIDPTVTVANAAVSFFAGVLKLPLGLIK
jgi:translocation and assembly module TamB